MKKCFVHLLALSALFASTYGLANNPANLPSSEYTQIVNSAAHDTNLSAQAVETALKGYQWALHNNKVNNKNILTIVDFTVSSAAPRMYVFNIKSGEVLMSLYVTHGKNSGTGKYATSFSNKTNSLMSSLGVYVTENTYIGKHGFSLRINGLEKSNNNALKRAVVVHAANYATPEYIQQKGKAGNSWGCFAVNPKQLKLLVNYIKDGTVLYAYGQSKEYAATSQIFTVAENEEQPSA